MKKEKLPSTQSAKLIDRAAKEAVDATDTLLGALSKHRGKTQKLYKKARQKNIEIYLGRLPLYALKEVGASNVRVSALEDAGVRTIGDVLSRGQRRLQHIKGVGPHSATTAHDGAVRIKRIAEKKLPVRLDDDVRPKEEEKLLKKLMFVRKTHGVLGHIKKEAEEVQAELGSLRKKARPVTRWWQRPFLSKTKKNEALFAYETTRRYITIMDRSGLREAILLAARQVTEMVPQSAESLWGGYTEEPETFDTLLRSIVGYVPDDAEQLPLGAPPERGPGPRDGITTVYRMFDHRNKLLYVGISNRVDLRIEQHRKDKEWFWQIDRIATENYPDRATALDVEKNAIKTEKPVHNVVHNQ